MAYLHSLADIPLTGQEALSGIFGSISLVAWIVVLVPQLIQNYRAQSAEAISIPFLLIWFVGDVANLTGSLWAGLVPTVTALAIYFCFADFILILQCFYYNWLNRKLKAEQEEERNRQPSIDEEAPLLSRVGSHASNSSAPNLGLPGSHKRRRSSATSRRTLSTGHHDSEAHHALSKIVEDEQDGEDNENGGRAANAWLKNIVSILLICAVGAAGWAIAYKAGAWRPAAAAPPKDGGEGKGADTPVGAEVLGYMSAVLYLGARIPQIIKNWRQKSCEGLSLLFFLLSLVGNVTYGAGILVHSTERNYVLTNLPWLIGSLGTMAEDMTIFIQFHIYGAKGASDEAVE